MRYDHKDIHSKIPNGFHMTRYEDLTGWGCLGNVLPTCKWLYNKISDNRYIGQNSYVEYNQ